jgi:flagellar motor switch protein FliN/FliY
MIPSQPRDPEFGLEPPAPCPEDAGLRENGGTLDLLLDMELPLTVRFGSARMPIADVLKLTAGSVIDLDRAAENAVELLVNGKVVARGTAVTVQGNYGVRISEITAGREGVAHGPGLGAPAARDGREN